MKLLAKDLMTSDVTTITEDQSVDQLIHIFRVSQFTGIPVVDEDGKALGLVSETDILRALAYSINPPGSGEVQTKTKFKDRDRLATTRLLRAAEQADLQVHAAVVMRELLTRRVHDLMTPVVHSCSPDTPLAEVCQTMVWKGVHRIVVTDEANKVVGLISSLDLAQSYAERLKQDEAAGG